MQKGEIGQMDGLNPNSLEEKMTQLRNIVPEFFSDGRIDFEKLKAIVGNENMAEDERYRLEWAGKSAVFDEIAKRTSCTVTIDEKRSSKDWEKSNNVFIEGENLEVLRMLQKAYHGKVKMIYIDPPYNTGKDFVYNDNFRQTEDEYCEDECDVDENGNLQKAYKLNSRDSGRYHSNWLSMMYPRLYLARNLLRDDGVIFVSIDDHEVQNLQLIMNEIFGEENFISKFAVQLNPRGRHLDKFVAKTHEYILVYVKNAESPDAIRGLNKAGAMEAEYDKEDERGRYRLIGLRNRNQTFNPETRPKLFYALYVNPSTCQVSLTTEGGFTEEAWPITSDGVKTCWTWGKDKVKKEYEKLEAHKVGDEWRISRKDYFLDEEGNIAQTLSKSLWVDKEINNDVGKKAIKELFGASVMDFPKSPLLIKRLVQIGTENSDIVIDFFAGSGTTAHAVMIQNSEDGGNRTYICAQIPEETPEGSEARKAKYTKISDIAIDRIKKAAVKIKDENPEFEGDLEVRVYRATDSHFPQWHARAFENDEQLKQAMIDYSNTEISGSVQDRATEVLLKLGYPLTTPLEERSGYLVTPDSVVLVLSEAYKARDLMDILKESPKTVIVLEKIFKKDEDKINFSLRCKEVGVIFQTV